MLAADGSRRVRTADGFVIRDEPPIDRGAGDRRLGTWLFAAMVAAYLTTAGGSLATSDAVVTYDVTRQLVEHRSIALSSDLIGNQAYLGSDGKYYSPFGILQAVWNIPFYVAGRVAHAVVHPRSVSLEMVTKATVALGNACTAAIAVWLVWLVAVRSGSSARGALTAALIAGFCTSLWPYSKFGFNVPLSAVLVSAAGLFSLEGVRTARAASLWSAGLMCGLALLTRHEFALIALSSALLVAWCLRRRRLVASLVWWALGAAPGALVWGWYNFIRYGSPIDTGYFRDQTLGMGGSIIDGIWGLLASPGSSVFLYSPVMLVAIVAAWRVRAQRPQLAWWLCGTTVLFTLFYAQLGSWAGGRSYGPRYLVPFLPALCVPLALWSEQGGRMFRAVLVGVAVLSCVVQIPGVLVDFAKVRVAYARSLDGATYESRMQEWSASPLALNTEASARAVPLVARHLMGLDPKPALPDTPSADSRDFSQRFAFSVDAWWIYLFYLGALPAWASAGAGLTLSLICLSLLALAWRRAGRLDRSLAVPVLPAG